MFGKFEKRMSGTQMIALGFLLLIFIGTILLMLPVSSRNGEWTPFITALFTSTSATCVTGLVLVDTFTHWSIFLRNIKETVIPMVIKPRPPI